MTTKWITLLQDNDYIGVKQYLKEGADINDLTETDENVISCALRYRCDNDIIELLVKNGADVNEYDNEGVSVFECAITYNNFKFVEYMIERGVDINDTKRRSGFTPLMAAACYGRVEMLELILSAGADVEKYDRKGYNAFDYARKMQKKSIISRLEQENDETTQS
ncbi:MAG: ankyrin repeat domain-containing protein [Campylobacterota bacterium]|nr:ankyrin repeat domain-containing protein [Campylobacterota bacterium]